MTLDELFTTNAGYWKGDAALVGFNGYWVCVAMRREGVVELTTDGRHYFPELVVHSAPETKKSAPRKSKVANAVTTN